MDGGSFTLRWDDDSRSSSDFQGQGGGIISEEVIPALDTVNSHHYSMDGHQSHMNPDVIIPDTDQIAAENLIFLAQDIVGHMNSYSDQGQHYSSDNFTVDQVDLDHAGEIECQVTEEVITDDWVQPGGQERVEVPLEQLALVNVEIHNEGNDIDVPLPTDQDEYTAMRPYPCDFCSRRFRKKANLMNHMVAHQNDRPYGCNLCGARYVRKCDLMNHLKVHAYVPDDGDEELIEEPPKRRSRKRSAQSSNAEKSSTYSDKTAVAARTQQYEGPVSGNSNAAASLRQRYEATDPSRPFVCQHCGVGFAREKALASHARIHGGDSPLECCVCGELCWSRENLISHTHSKHPHKSPQAFPVYEADATSEESLAEDDEGSQSWVELICKDCGAGFQRADLLQRHTRAAHTHLKKEIEDVDKSKESENSTMEVVENWEGMEHACSVCGEHFRDALELLAHAESHARRNNRCMHCGEKFADNSMVTEHVISAHPNLPPNSCLFCGRTCNDQRGLNKHIASQHEIPPGKMLFCSKCGKHFHSKARLKRHMESHRDKGVTCNECGESFENGRSLMNHRHSHKGTAGRQFPCLECGKTFGSRSSQQIHIRIHTGERPYGCRFCWKAFADGGTLRKHERIHTGEKPYACAICPRAFNQRVVLREHVRSHHSGPDSRHGTGAAPYWCPVCDRLMTSSVELVHHIIQHCDNNTALKRQPQTGPRKYKRRRKLQQVDLKTSPTGPKNDSDHSLSESELPSSLMKKPVPVRKSRTDKRSISPLEDNNDSLQNTSKSSADSSAGGSARTKGKLKPKRAVEIPTRPKMIHTQRNKPSDASTTVTRRKGRSANALVTTCVPISDERIRPRTKNVTYHDGVGRLPAATFPSSVKPEPEGDINADLRAILKDPLTIEYVDEQSTIENLKSEPHEDENTNSYFSVKEETEETVTIEEDGPFRCEMCSESFGLHEELVTHVRVHI